jgi:eukaryotic-like serine/threonine-protein kinase
MGEVFEAVHTGLDRRVAIKTLQRRFVADDACVARFLREGQLASRIRHPNIVDVTDAVSIDGVPCLVMELLEGESLHDLFSRRAPMPVEALVDLLLPIIAALDFAHERGVFHRDIKPSNIFVARSWNGEITPKILDFGLSKLLDVAPQAGLTTDAHFVGTPQYASPELIRDHRTADRQSDQYALGVVLYEGLTGRRPYPDNRMFLEHAMAVCKGEFPRPRQLRSDLPIEIEEVVLKAMALRPQDRHTSMRALGFALLPYASDRGRVIWGPSFSDPTRKIHTPINAIAPSSFVGVASASVHLPRLEKMLHRVGAVGLAGFVLTFVAAAGILLAAIERQPRAAAASAGSVVATTPTPADASPGYALTIQAVPSEAEFELDGIVVATGKLDRVLLDDGKKHSLWVSAPGYSDFFVEFDEAHRPPANVVLRPSFQPVASSQATSNAPAPAPSASPPGRRGEPGKFPEARPRTDNIDPWQ